VTRHSAFFNLFLPSPTQFLASAIWYGNEPDSRSQGCCIQKSRGSKVEPTKSKQCPNLGAWIPGLAAIP
jgi:hypothetical protein